MSRPGYTRQHWSPTAELTEPDPIFGRSPYFSHVRAWLRTGMAVQPMAMEIKEALMVSLVPAYLVKGPVVEHWVKHRIAGLEHGHFLGF